MIKKNKIFCLLLLQIFFLSGLTKDQSIGKLLLVEDALSPRILIDNPRIKQEFTKNPSILPENVLLFSSGQEDRPRWNLTGKELKHFQNLLQRITNIVSNFNQSLAFKGRLLKEEELRLLEQVSRENLKKIDIARADALTESLINIIDRGLSNIEMIKLISGKVLDMTPYPVWLEKLERNLREAVKMLQPYFPVKSIILNKEIEPYLAFEIKEKILECVSWQKMAPDLVRGGRSIIINLDQPIKLKRGKVITALEIKGVIFNEKSQSLPPLLEIYDIFPINTLYQDNTINTSYSVSLKGALPLKNAKREYQILALLQQREEFEVNYPVGFGEYRNFTFHGKKFGFLISGLENSRELRLWEIILRQHKDELIKIRQYRDVRAAAELFKKYPNLFRVYGYALREFHDAGYFHGYPHLANVSWDNNRQKIKFHDFESTKMVRYSRERKLGYRLIDLVKAYTHFLSFVFGRQENMQQRRLLTAELNQYGNPFIAFLEGYFLSDKKEKKDLEVMFDEMLDIFSHSQVAPIHEARGFLVMRRLFAAEQINIFSSIRLETYAPKQNQLLPASLVEQAI